MDGERFGCIEHAVVCKPDGEAIFDRALVFEGPHVITVAWGFDPSSGEPMLALVKEARDTVALPDGKTSVAFWGPPRGFRGHSETPQEAARREAGEEAGANVVLETQYLGDFYVNETCVASASPTVLLQLDLDRVGAIRADRGEKIYKAEFFPAYEIERMIAAGEHEGALTTSKVLLANYTLWRLYVLNRLGDFAGL
ncbi:NUDIX domain-containing protein [Patescibacteria group bacterium]|jgi:8-oxo-dGTP pyrophosphatase MutT (NUDIX family)|nr:NUDIX domain-containing protein [Patescibacteria group bacterium]